MKSQDLKRRVLRRWSRDGLVQQGSYLRRPAVGLTHVVYAQATSGGALEVELAVHVGDEVEENGRILVENCDIRGPLCAVDGSRHLDPATLTFAWLAEQDEESFENWCSFVYETAIKHFFLVFSSAEACESTLRAGLNRHMGLMTSSKYRNAVGVTRPNGAWLFAQGVGAADPVEVLNQLSRKTQVTTEPVEDGET